MTTVKILRHMSYLSITSLGTYAKCLKRQFTSKIRPLSKLEDFLPNIFRGLILFPEDEHVENRGYSSPDEGRAVAKLCEARL